MDEFLNLARYIEPERLPVTKAEELFKKLCDNTNDLTTLSFSNFAIGCVEYSLFSVESQKVFLGTKSDDECLEKVQAFIKEENIKLIKQRLKSVSKLPSYMKNWIFSIDEVLKKEISKESSHIKIGRASCRERVSSPV